MILRLCIGNFIFNAWVTWVVIIECGNWNGLCTRHSQLVEWETGDSGQETETPCKQNCRDKRNVHCND